MNRPKKFDSPDLVKKSAEPIVLGDTFADFVRRGSPALASKSLHRAVGGLTSEQIVTIEAAILRLARQAYMAGEIDGISKGRRLRDRELEAARRRRARFPFLSASDWRELSELAKELKEAKPPLDSPDLNRVNDRFLELVSTKRPAVAINWDLIRERCVDLMIRENLAPREARQRVLEQENSQRHKARLRKIADSTIRNNCKTADLVERLKWAKRKGAR